MQVRFKTDDVVIHLASAGSGKTTAAMNEIASALREYRPDEIAFVTYTKKGVENGIERALKVNPDLTPDDLMHFKTLHALCFREAHLTRKNMMSSDDIARFNEAFGFSLSLSDAFGYVSEDDRLLQRYDAQRSGSRRGVFVDGNFDRFRYDRLVNAYEAFKEAHGLVDFFDCLTLYMERGEPLKGVKLAVIDECQDLTALQWQVCMKAFAGAERIRCFGDDFQCQPAGTRVLTVQGEKLKELVWVPIEDCGGKSVMAYDINSNSYKVSPPVTVEAHTYTGKLFEVYTMGQASGALFTPEHKMVVRNAAGVQLMPLYECSGRDDLFIPCYAPGGEPAWHPMQIATYGYVTGTVCSIDVPEYHTYVCDFGITSHNCLYTYNGAAPELLVEMASHYETVKHETSYRLPRRVYEFARGITDVIQEKVEKDYKPATDREGFVRELGDRNVLARVIRDDLRANGPKPGRWYLLFRTNCFIADMAKTLEQFIVPYHTVKGFCIPKRELARIERYYNFRKEGFGSAESRARFAEEYRIKDFNESFTESELIPGRERYFFQDLVDAYGIKALKAMCDMDEPWLLLSTVHRVKGGEADYTAMFMDCTRVVSENMTLSADDELRVLYVGCTRCREGLYLIPAQGKYSMSRLLDIVREVNDV